MDTDRLVDEVRDYIRQAVQPLALRLTELEARMGELIPHLKAQVQRGEPGVGVAGAMINRDGDLVLTLSDGTAHKLGPVVGRDGFSLTDFAAVYDGERGLTLTFESGDIKRECALHLPTVIHRGFWRDGTHARAGDAWTCDGSLWIAKTETGKKPCYENREEWTLACRKGRDAAEPATVKEAPGPKTLHLKKGRP